MVYKMTGSGNDFVFVDGRSCPLDLWNPEAIRGACARQTGVGADGLAVLEPGSAPGRVRLHYFNSDGVRAALCGNASLCATRLSRWLEMAPADGVELETDAGLIPGRCLPGPAEMAEVNVGEVSEVRPSPVELEPGESWADFVRVGVPHLVVMVGDVSRVPVGSRGRVLRHHLALGPDGANVDFVGRRGSGWSVRTFERGVEAETLACGTGAVAVASVLAERGLADFPVELETASGKSLGVVRISGPESGTQCFTLRGEGRLVFRAVLGS